MADFLAESFQFSQRKKDQWLTAGRFLIRGRMREDRSPGDIAAPNQCRYPAQGFTSLPVRVLCRSQAVTRMATCSCWLL